MHKYDQFLQFAHGKEELRPTRFPAAKNKTEVKNEKNMGLLIFVDIYILLYQLVIMALLGCTDTQVIR
jgi:hypothetical protein